MLLPVLSGSPIFRSARVAPLFATWYDGRGSTSCRWVTRPSRATKCSARKSTDNGATWLADMSVQRRSQPPARRNPTRTVVACYAGDYDYGSATTAKHVTSWVDGRVSIAGQSQQDPFTRQGASGRCNTNSNSDSNSCRHPMRRLGFFPSALQAFCQRRQIAGQAYPHQYEPLGPAGHHHSRWQSQFCDNQWQPGQTSD